MIYVVFAPAHLMNAFSHIEISVCAERHIPIGTGTAANTAKVSVLKSLKIHSQGDLPDN